MCSSGSVIWQRVERPGFEHSVVILTWRVIHLHLQFEEKQKNRKRSSIKEMMTAK